MDDISKLSQELRNQQSIGIGKGSSSKKRLSPSDELEKSAGNKIGQDKTRITPVKEWVQTLKEMSFEEADEAMEAHHEEHLLDVAEKLDSGFYEEKFDEVFPRLFNELSKDWNIKFPEKDLK